MASTKPSAQEIRSESNTAMGPQIQTSRAQINTTQGQNSQPPFMGGGQQQQQGGQFFIPYAAYNGPSGAPGQQPGQGGGNMNPQMQQQSYFNIEASGGFPSGRMLPGLPVTFSPQAPPLLGPLTGQTSPISSTIVFSSEPHLSSTTTTTTGIAEVKLDGNKMTISTNVAPFTPDKLEVKAADNKITIKASSQEERDASGYIKTKEFHRQYLIPMGCDPDKMKCFYESGTLKIRVVIPERLEKVLPIEFGQAGPQQQGMMYSQANIKMAPTTNTQQQQMIQQQYVPPRSDYQPYK